MPVICLILHQFYPRCSSFDLRTVLKYFLLSCFASIFVNFLLPSFAEKDSSSSSLTLFSSTHIFFPSDVNSLQCSPTVAPRRSSRTKSNDKRTYTKKDLRSTSNISRGKTSFERVDISLFFSPQDIDKKQKWRCISAKLWRPKANIPKRIGFSNTP